MNTGNKMIKPKTEKRLLNIITLITLNSVYFFCNSYPKYLLDLTPDFFIPTILFNIAFFFCFFSFLIICFTNNSMLFSEDVFGVYKGNTKRKFFMKLLLLLGTQAFIDLLKLGGSSLLKEYSYVIDDLLTLLCWILFFVILTHKGISFNSKKPLCIFFGCITLFAICVVLSNFKDIELYRQLVNKYEITDAYFVQTIRNMDFLHGVLNFVIDTIIGSIFIVFRHVNSEMNIVRNSKISSSATGIRVMVILAIAFFMIAIKIIIFPNSAIRGFNIKSTNEKQYVKDHKFSSTSKTYSITQVNGYESSIISYQVTKTKIWYDGQCTAVINANDNIAAYSYEIRGNQMIMIDPFKDYLIGGTPVYIYNNRAISYLKNGKPYTILLEDIKDCENDSTLVGISEKMISDGNWVYFEYCSEYLLKYDPDFIKQYIKKYAQASFEQQEINKECNTGYRQDYIKNIASSLLKYCE